MMACLRLCCLEYQLLATLGQLCRALVSSVVYRHRTLPLPWGTGGQKSLPPGDASGTVGPNHSPRTGIYIAEGGV